MGEEQRLLFLGPLLMLTRFTFRTTKRNGKDNSGNFGQG